MTPANEAWIREVAECSGTGNVITIARLCIAEIDSLRKQLKEASHRRPERTEAPPAHHNPRTISITKERLEYLETRDHRLTRWDEWARQVNNGDAIPPMPVVAIHRRRKAGQA